jgi:hypothetical protein
MNFVSESLKLTKYCQPILRKFALRQSLDILKHDRGWARFAYKSNGFREEISLVSSTQLVASHRERGARDTARQEINAMELRPVKFSNIVLNNIPVRPVQPQ